LRRQHPGAERGLWRHAACHLSEAGVQRGGGNLIPSGGLVYRERSEETSKSRQGEEAGMGKLIRLALAAAALAAVPLMVDAAKAQDSCQPKIGRPPLVRKGTLIGAI